MRLIEWLANNRLEIHQARVDDGWRGIQWVADQAEAAAIARYIECVATHRRPRRRSWL